MATNSVNNFIGRFREHDSVIDTFCFGCCYWFALILSERFKKDSAVIMYDEVENHFGVMVHGVVYDITGDVTNDYNWIPWSSLDDDLLRSRIIRDCIMF